MCSKRGQDGPRVPKRAPRCSQRRPHGSKMAPKMSQCSPRRRSGLHKNIQNPSRCKAKTIDFSLVFPFKTTAWRSNWEHVGDIMLHEGATIIRFRPLGVQLESQGGIGQTLRNQDGSNMPNAKSGSSTDEKQQCS